MPVVGYSAAGNTDDVTVAAKEMILTRLVIADLLGETPAYVKARIGHSANGDWAASIWDESGTLLGVSNGNYFGNTAIGVITFPITPSSFPGGDTYFYVSIQWDGNVGKFQYESSIDSYFYNGSQVDYLPYPVLDPLPSDNHVGTPCLWVTTGLPPSNTVPPVASGTAEVGAVLSCSTGTWTESPTSYQYQWYVNDVLQGGETNSTYTVQAGDLGLLVNCRVFASNGNGQSTSSSPSNYIGPITAPSGNPVNTVAPVVTGVNTLLGVILSTDDGQWTNDPTHFTYQWQRDCGGGPVDITGETDDIYATSGADLGCTIACAVTAYNNA